MGKSKDAFRTIGEASKLLGVQPHILRFWESKFPQVKPVIRAGKRRYYRSKDIDFLAGLRVLLHEQNQTAKSVKTLLQENGQAHICAIGQNFLMKNTNVGDTAAMTPTATQGDITAPLVLEHDNRILSTQEPHTTEHLLKKSAMPQEHEPDQIGFNFDSNSTVLPNEFFDKKSTHMSHSITYFKMARRIQEHPKFNSEQQVALESITQRCEALFKALTNFK